MIRLVLIILFIVLKGFSQEEQGKTSDSISSKQKPLLAYWLKNLYFVRGVTYVTEFMDTKGSGAFRSRWRFIYSNPIGKQFSLVAEIPVVLVAPPEGKSVAGLGEINTLFQVAITERKTLKQTTGLGIYFPTISHNQIAIPPGNRLTLNPRYQIDYIGNKYIVPSFPIDYRHSVIEIDNAPKLRLLSLLPIIAFKQLGPEKFGISGSVQLAWLFNFVPYQTGGILPISLAKQLNPNTLISFQFSPALSSFTRDILWERLYQVNLLSTF